MRRLPKTVLLCMLPLLGLGATRAKVGLAGDPALLAAGDIAQCDSPGAERTAQLIKVPRLPVLALGDLAYPRGTPEEFARCYDANWGAFKNRTYPAAGNHEYRTPGVGGYFGYFSTRAAIPRRDTPASTWVPGISFP